MKSEMVACDNPDCTIKATVPKHKSSPDEWFLVFGPDGRNDFCSIGCLSLWARPSIRTSSNALEPTR